MRMPRKTSHPITRDVLHVETRPLTPQDGGRRLGDVKDVLDRNQRKGLAAALYSLGNIVAASLIVGQFVGAGGFRAGSFVIGFLLFVAAYLIATKLNREEPG